MHLLQDCRLWLLDHLNSVQLSLIFLQLQKVLAIIIWYSERSHSLTLLKSINDSLCGNVVKSWISCNEVSGYTTWTYAFVCFFGMNAVGMKNAFLIGSFLLVDTIFVIVLYTTRHIDSVIIPLIILLSFFLNLLFLYLLSQVRHHRPIVLYGPPSAERPTTTIPSPPESDCSTSSTNLVMTE